MGFKAPNYTQTPNEFFDDIAKTLTEGELRVLLVIIRQTFGWRKEWDRISISQLAKKTGLDPRSVKNIAKRLIEKKLIKKRKTGTPGDEKCWYSLVADEPQKDEIIPDNIDEEDDFKIIHTGDPTITSPVILGSPTKETPTKEIKESPPLIPPEGGKPDKPAHFSKPSKRKKIKEEFMQRCDRVNTTPTQHDSLLKEANQNATLLREWYETLSKWKIGKGLDGGSGDYKAIINWVINAVKAKKSLENQPSSLNEAQKKNLELNTKAVDLLKLTYPEKTIKIWHKDNYMTCNEPSFDISLLISHEDFLRFIEKKFRIRFEEKHDEGFENSDRFYD